MASCTTGGGPDRDDARLGEAVQAATGAPTVTSFTPASGTRGTVVTVTGTGFTGATGVTFGETSAPTFTVASDTSLQATVPDGALTGKIAVITSLGTGTSSTNFKVTPVITGFTPASGLPGTSVTITGSAFTGATAVKFAGTAATFTVSNDTTIAVVVPSGAGNGTIKVTTAGGTATSPLPYVAAAPVVTSFSPTSGAEGVTVTVNGNGFLPSASVSFGDVASADVTYVSETQLQVTVPVNASTGPITVRTTFGGGTSATSFTVKPVVTSFTPTSGIAGTSVTILGDALDEATAVTFGTLAASFTVLGGRVMAVVPAGATTSKIKVTTPAGTATSASSFTIQSAPHITSFLPTSGVDGASVTITGTHLTGVTAATFNGVAAAITDVTATTVTVTVPAGATTGPLSVTNDVATATSAGTFSVLPTIASFSPGSGFVLSTVTLSGSGFTGATSVTLGGVAATFTVSGDAAISVVVPASSSTGTFTVTTPAGAATSAAAFAVVNPCAGVSCTPSDQCHVAGTCDPSSGQCTNPAAPNGTACNDGNACTTNDVCTGGVCGGAAVTCTASDQCHVAGTCNPTTGACSNPPAADGTACNDGNACTTSDVCTGGVCGGTAVTCTASDQCHVAGTCNPTTGACSNPTAPNGTACNDNNACTNNDVCRDGACGGTAVTCTASDQCHVAGTCNPATGTCSNPAVADGTACNDGNACTTSDVCSGGVCGGTAVTCTASDQCHVAGTCNPATGTCSNPTVADGTACNDGNACTTSDVCTGGVCSGKETIVCTASDQCHVTGTCDPATGACSNPIAANGTPCDDGSLCTQSDTCQAGACVGTPVSCAPADSCHLAGTCAPETGCTNPTKPDGSSCNDGNACTTNEVCSSGMCGGTPVNVDDGNPCTRDACDPATGRVTHVPTPGASCSTRNACQVGTCSADGVCQVTRNAPAGASCSDGNPCNGVEACDGSGNCAATAPLPDGAACSGDPCTPHVCTAGQCVASAPLPDGTPCADGSVCKLGAVCASGACNASVNDGVSCSDGDACNGLETCSGGACAPGVPVAGLSAPGDPCNSDLCDPVSGALTQVACTPIVRSAPTNLYAASAFIMAEQPGAVIDPRRIAVVRGHVFDTAGNPLPNVTITVPKDPLSAATRTRLDGHFDMAVNGGGTVTLRYTKPGYLTVDRPLATKWQEYGQLPDVVLTRLDPAISQVALGAEGLQVARGPVVEDQRGVRRATILIPPGTSAQLVFPDGTQQPYDGTLSIHATEYTVGVNGPKAMPAGLPVTSAYTYAVDFTADEATALGARSIVFVNATTPAIPQPSIGYLENFLSFPVGGTIPSGDYNPDLQAWVPTPSGHVLQILSISGGQATLATQLDANNNPVHNDADEQALGITDAERAALASLYVAGQTLWRVPLPQLTDPDWNVPYAPSAPPQDVCAIGATGCWPPDPAQEPNPDEQCHGDPGSTISCQGQVLGETIPLAGVPYSLNYSSDRVPGRQGEFRYVSIPLIGNTVPPALQRIDVEAEIAGRVFTTSITCPCAGATPYVLHWNGLDGFGRPVNGRQPVDVNISYVYQANYVNPGGGPNPVWGTLGAYVTQAGAESAVWSPSTQEVSFVKHWSGFIGGWDARGEGLGGWEVNVHHVYDPTGRALYLGDGTQRSTESIASTATLQMFATPDCGSPPNQACSPPYFATGAPMGVAALADGSVVFSDAANNLVRKLDSSGALTTVATVQTPGDLAAASDGTLYVVSNLAGASSSQVYQIAPGGVPTLFAGNGALCVGYEDDPCGDGGPAIAAPISIYAHISVASDGALIISDYGAKTVRRVDLAGNIVTIAGSDNIVPLPYVEGALGTTVGGLSPMNVLAAPDGNIYFSSNTSFGYGVQGPTSAIHAIRPDGTIVTIARSGASLGQPAADGYPALGGTSLFPSALAMSLDGLLYFDDDVAPPGTGAVREIRQDGTVATVAGLQPGVPYPAGACRVGATGCNNVPATGMDLGSAQVNALAFAPDGSLIIAASSGTGGFILSVGSPVPRYGVGTIQIPSADAREIYTFDSAGRHLTTSDAVTGITKYVFGYGVNPATLAPDRLTQITYALGTSNVTTIGYDDVKGIRTVTGPFGDATVLTLDGFTNLASVSRQGGPANASRVETYSLTATPDGLLTSFSDPNGTLTMQPHAMTYFTSGSPPTGRLSTDADPMGGLQTLSISDVPIPLGLDSTVTRSERGDANQTYSATYEISYDSAGNEVRTNHSPGVANPTISTIGKDQSELDVLPDGTKIQTTYTPDPRFGMLAPMATTTTTLPLNNLSMKRQTVRVPDGPGGKFQEIVYIGGGMGGAWIRTYDPMQNTIAMQTPAGRTSLTTLDAQGRPVAVTAPGVGTIALSYTLDYSQPSTVTRTAPGEQPRVVQNLYYGPGAGLGYAGRPSGRIDPLNHQVSFTSYDLAGRVLGETLANGAHVGFAYDANGNAVEVDPPPASQAYASTQTFPAQHLFGFTPLDQLATYSVKDATSGTVVETSTYGYTPDHILKSLLRPEGDQVVTSSSFGRLDTVSLPSGESIHYGYEPATGRLQSVTGPGGVAVAFSYNGPLVTDATWSGLPQGIGLHVDYDAVLRPAAETLVAPGSSPSIAYGYDPDNLVTCVGLTTSCTGVSIGRWPGSSLLEGTTFPISQGELSESYLQNGFGELLYQVATEVLPFGQQYIAYQMNSTRDAVGRVASKTEQIAGFAPFGFTYQYDAAGRLTDVVREDGTQVHYDYDANGNRLRRTSTGPGGSTVELATYGVGDQLLSYNGTTYMYTASGRLQSATNVAGKATYSYDAEGNLRAVALPDGRMIQYLVDGLNRRVGKMVNGQLLQAWVYRDALRVAAEIDFDGTGNVTETKHFGYGSKANVPDLMVTSDGTQYRIVSDQLGSPRVIVADDGTAPVSMEHDEFGREIADGRPGFLPFGFAGGLYDPDTGLVRFGARDYDPVTGRWTAKDPTRFGGGSLSLYAYALNDPVNQYDVSGLQAIAYGSSDPTVVLDAIAWGLGFYQTPFQNDNYLIIFSHGFPQELTIPSGQTNDVGAISDWIRTLPGYSPDSPIVLNACFAGAGGGDSVAAQLSLKLGVPVAGPSSIINGLGNIGPSANGGWRVFVGGVESFGPWNIVGL